jgi:uncharacterized membrane protein
MGVLYGLAAALCWGLGDFLITILTRRIGTPRAIFATQILSLATWLILLFLMPSSPDSGINVWALAIIAGVCHVTALLLTYRAFEIGTLALVSPIISGFAVVTAVAGANERRASARSRAGRHISAHRRRRSGHAGAVYGWRKHRGVRRPSEALWHSASCSGCSTLFSPRWASSGL